MAWLASFRKSAGAIAPVDRRLTVNHRKLDGLPFIFPVVLARTENTKSERTKIQKNYSNREAGSKVDVVSTPTNSVEMVIDTVLAQIQQPRVTISATTVLACSGTRSTRLLAGHFSVRGFMTV